MKTIESWKQLLRARLREALAKRQSQVVTVLRETLAALENAEAPPLNTTDEAPIGDDSAFAGSMAGLGAGDISRLALSPEAVAGIIARELAERRQAASEYARLGRDDEARVLELQIEVLESLEREPA